MYTQTDIRIVYKICGNQKKQHCLCGTVAGHSLRIPFFHHRIYMHENVERWPYALNDVQNAIKATQFALQRNIRMSMTQLALHISRHLGNRMFQCLSQNGRHLGNRRVSTYISIKWDALSGKAWNLQSTKTLAWVLKHKATQLVPLPLNWCMRVQLGCLLDICTNGRFCS